MTEASAQATDGGSTTPPAEPADGFTYSWLYDPLYSYDPYDVKLNDPVEPPFGNLAWRNFQQEEFDRETTTDSAYMSKWDRFNHMETCSQWLYMVHVWRIALANLLDKTFLILLVIDAVTDGVRRLSADQD
jgi:hypothetical protein